MLENFGQSLRKFQTKMEIGLDRSLSVKNRLLMPTALIVGSVIIGLLINLLLQYSWVLVALLWLWGIIVALAVYGNPRKILIFVYAASLPIWAAKSFYTVTSVVPVSGAAGIYVSAQDIILVTLFLLLFLFPSPGMKRLSFSVLDKTVILFTLVAVASASTAYSSVFGYLEALRLVKVVCLYYVVGRTIQLNEVPFLLKGIVLGVIFEGGVVLYQYIFREPIGFLPQTAEFIGIGTEELLGFFKLGGTLGNGNTLAKYLQLTLPIILSFLLHRERNRDRMILWLGLGVGTVALILTGSRGGWLGFLLAVGLIFVVYKLGHRSGISTLRGLSMLMLLVILVLAFSDFMMLRLTGNDYGASQSRPITWNIALGIIQQWPFLGIGLNNYALFTYNLYGSLRYAGVDSLYLLIAAESGVIASVLFFLAQIFALVGIFKALKRSESKVLFSIGSGLSGALLATMVYGVVGWGLIIDPVWPLYWFALGMCGALTNSGKSGELHAISA